MMVGFCVMWGFPNGLALNFDVVSISLVGGICGLWELGGVWDVYLDRYMLTI